MPSALCRSRGICIALLAVTTLGGACQRAEVNLPSTPSLAGSPTPTAIVLTPLPPEPKTLIVCLGREPESLYLYSPLRLYGAANREADVVLQAIYDGPIDARGYTYAPVILEKMPSIRDGDARLEPVTVREGDIYLNPDTLLPQPLQEGDRFLPSGCRDLSCAQSFGGEDVSMDQLVVDFRLLPDIRWSDGEPLTAADSVFSFRLNGHRDTRDISKFMVIQTASYVAVDERTVRWTGIPGFLDPDYASNFWTPLPEHQLAGLSPGDLSQAEESARRPLGWGPYVIEAWESGERIVLSKNPLYFRADEGLPRFDDLVFRFMGGDPQAAIQQLLTGECDVLDETALEGADIATLQDLQQSGALQLALTAGPVVDRIDLNLNPLGPPDSPSLFSDETTRRAIVGCIDRQDLNDDLLGGLGQVTDTYLPPDHPLYATGIQPIPYDPVSAAASLEDLGWLDTDGSPETPRTSQGVPGVRGGTPLEFTLLTGLGAFQEALAQQLREDLAQCGIGLHVETLDAPQLLAAFPDGPVFGRTFQAVEWSWLATIAPACDMFASREIPSQGNPNRSNASGFSDEEYDVGCQALLLGLPEDDAYRQGAQRTQEIFTARVPAIPLFVRPRLAAYGKGVCGVSVDASAYSVLWNLEDLGPEGTCEAR